MSFPLIQGNYVSWSEIEIKLAVLGGPTFVTADFSALKWEEGRERAGVPGTGPNELGSTGGMYKASAEISMYYAKYVAFQTALEAIALASNLKDKFGVPFDVIAQWSPIGISQVHTVKIPGCHILKLSSDNAPGPDATSITIPLFTVARISQT